MPPSRANVNLPQWFAPSAQRAMAIIGGLVALRVMVHAGWLDNWLGERYPPAGGLGRPSHPPRSHRLARLVL